MNASDIYKRLRTDPRTNSQLMGVYAEDTLPLLVEKKPSLYVVNTDVSAGAGLHWVVFYIPDDSDVAEFFDPLGHSPGHYSMRFEHFLLINTRKYKYQKDRLQGFQSDACGHYCVFYSIRRCNAWTLEKIVDVFDKYLKSQNDQIVRNFY